MCPAKDTKRNTRDHILSSTASKLQSAGFRVQGWENTEQKLPYTRTYMQDLSTHALAYTQTYRYKTACVCIVHAQEKALCEQCAL